MLEDYERRTRLMISDTLYRYMGRNALSFKEVAKELGIRKKDVKKILERKADLRLSVIVKIAKLTNENII